MWYNLTSVSDRKKNWKLNESQEKNETQKKTNLVFKLNTNIEHSFNLLEKDDDQ